MGTTEIANGCVEGRSGVSSSRALAAVLVAALAGACGESSPTLTIDIYKKEVVADDGYALSAFDLHLRGHPRDETPNAWMFYLVGSEPVAVMDATAQFADLVARGLGVVLLQPRGVSGDGGIDQEEFWQYDTRPRRVADQTSVMDAYLTSSDSPPVLLVGISQGGVVAADIAASDARVSHLLMMASGGGMNQAEELTICVQQEPGCVGMDTVEELDAKFDEISAAPDSGELWAGHPFRMWSSYLWFRPMDGLTALAIPMFLAQGTVDPGILESSRALRDGFAERGLTNLTYVEYPGLDHHFTDADGQSGLLDVQEDAYAWMTDAGLLDD